MRQNMRQKPKVCHPSCGLSRRFRGFGYTLNTTATCTYSKASIPATASRPSSQRMKVPTQDELTSLLHTKSKARHPDGPSETGTPGRIRTCDPLLRRQVLYPTELRALVWFGGRLERVSRRTLDLASFLDQGLLITGYTVPGPSKNIVPFPMQVHPARQRVLAPARGLSRSG